MVPYAPTIGSILLSLHKGADTMTARLKVKVLKACLPLAAVAALTAVPYQAAIDGSFMPASAQAAPGGKGAEKGKGQGLGKERGGTNSAASANNGNSQNSLKQSQKSGGPESNMERKELHEAIKDLADLLGGRINAMHSAINGNTSNAASHSAAGLAAAYKELGLLDTDELQIEDEEEENSLSMEAGEILGMLANNPSDDALTDPNEGNLGDTPSDDPLADAIEAFNNELAGVDGDFDPANIDKDEAAEATRATLDSKDGNGLGADQESPEDEENSF